MTNNSSVNGLAKGAFWGLVVGFLPLLIGIVAIIGGVIYHFATTNIYVMIAVIVVVIIFLIGGRNAYNEGLRTGIANCGCYKGKPIAENINTVPEKVRNIFRETHPLHYAGATGDLSHLDIVSKSSKIVEDPYNLREPSSVVTTYVLSDGRTLDITYTRGDLMTDEQKEKAALKGKSIKEIM